MRGEWQEVRLTDLYDISSGLSKPAKDFGSGYPFLAFKDVFNNYFVPDDLTQLVRSSEKEQKKCSVIRGDVFLTRTSETMHELGMSSVALKDYDRATFNGFTKRLRPKDCNELVPEYIGYYLRSQKFRNEMLAFSTMSTRASLNNEMISHLRISFPSISEQEDIAWVLKSLDDKIQLNRRMNTTLEAMTQALFKSWFVDFDPVIDKALAAGNPIPKPLHKRAEARKALGDKRKPLPADVAQYFPDRFVFKEEMGWVPEGWEESTIGDEVETVGGGTPSTKDPTFWEGGVHPFCTPKDMSALDSIVLMDTIRHLTDAGVKKISSGQLPKDVVLMSSRAPIGYLAISDVPVSVNQGIIAILPNQKYGSIYLLLWVHFNMGAIKDRANGSTFLEISKKNFRPISFLVPAQELTDFFNEQVKGIYNKMLLLSEETRALSTLRNTLLPKLLSGQLRIPDAEKIIGETAQPSR
ncbi:MAG: restriction endonuclease subunit S [Candidatus Electrothrix sp. AX5]|nr:restriction endonuclease subunit S [Candidatus Electrothrix sp. AX5]